MSDGQTAGHSLHNWEQQYWIKIVTGRLHSGNACYLAGQNLLFSRLLAKNLKLKIYKTIILPVVLYGIETWAVALRQKQRLRVFERRIWTQEGGSASRLEKST
jgi:hypothetical protein